MTVKFFVPVIDTDVAVFVIDVNVVVVVVVVVIVVVASISQKYTRDILGDCDGGGQM